MCMQMECGGFRIHSLGSGNCTLLCKWLWRFGEEGDSLWRKEIEVKYGAHSLGWLSAILSVLYGVSSWRGVAMVLVCFLGG